MAMKPRAMKKNDSKTKMAAGGMTKANAGASMKPGQKSTKKTPMRGGGMPKTKMMRGGMTAKKKK
jgi:hypothetical protein